MPDTTAPTTSTTAITMTTLVRRRGTPSRSDIAARQREGRRDEGHAREDQESSNGDPTADRVRAAVDDGLREGDGQELRPRGRSFPTDELSDCGDDGLCDEDADRDEHTGEL